MSLAPAPLLLMTPGPTRVPDRVLAAGARPMMHHRTPEFSRTLAGVIEGIRPLFGARGDVLPVHATGRGAMEACIANLLHAGEALVVCANGKFGELWAHLAKPYGVAVHLVAPAWGRDITLDDVEDALTRTRAAALACTYIDTSTGGTNDIAALARLARSAGALLFVDGVSAIGGVPCAFDEWEIDALVTASQKCLMSSPGASFVTLSDRAWRRAEHATLPRSYWDFVEIRSAVRRPAPETPGTPPVQALLHVAEALRQIHDEGADAVFARHAELAQRTRTGAAAIGFAPQCPGLSRPAATVTPLRPPDGVDPRRVRAALRDEGILIAGGLGQFAESAVRIGHMGDIRISDVERTLAALGRAAGRAAAEAAR